MVYQEFICLYGAFYHRQLTPRQDDGALIAPALAGREVAFSNVHGVGGSAGLAADETLEGLL